MKRKNHKTKLRLAKKTVRALDRDLLPVAAGALGIVPEGYGFTLNRHNCGNTAEI